MAKINKDDVKVGERYKIEFQLSAQKFGEGELVEIIPSQSGSPRKYVFKDIILFQRRRYAGDLTIPENLLKNKYDNAKVGETYRIEFIDEAKPAIEGILEMIIPSQYNQPKQYIFKDINYINDRGLDEATFSDYQIKNFYEYMEKKDMFILTMQTLANQRKLEEQDFASHNKKQENINEEINKRTPGSPKSPRKTGINTLRNKGRESANDIQNAWFTSYEGIQDYLGEGYLGGKKRRKSQRRKSQRKNK